METTGRLALGFRSFGFRDWSLRASASLGEFQAKIKPDERFVGAPRRIQSSRKAPREHRRSSAYFPKTPRLKKFKLSE